MQVYLKGRICKQACSPSIGFIGRPADASYAAGNLVIALQKNSTLTAALDVAMQLVIESGSLTALQRKWVASVRHGHSVNVTKHCIIDTSYHPIIAMVAC